MEILVNKKEVLRYLGYKEGRDLPQTTRTGTNEEKNIEERVFLHIDELINVFSANIVPKNAYSVFDCKIEETSLTIGSLQVNSENLSRHLSGCGRAVLLAATLGTEADNIIRRYSVQDMEKALVAQAVCAAMIEAYCDSIQSEIFLNDDFKGYYPAARFSPGYGDFDIAYQKDILSILNCSRIGIALTEGNMLVPTKSVTAVIGISKEKQLSNKCDLCSSPCELQTTTSRLCVFAPSRQSTGYQS